MTHPRLAQVAFDGLAPSLATVALDDDRVRFAPVDASSDLSPDYAQTLFVLYRVTKDRKYRDRGWTLFHQLKSRCRADSGAFFPLRDVADDAKGRKRAAPSHVLAQTLKFLFLLFSSPDVYPLDDWVFTPKGHLVSATTKCQRENDCTGPEAPQIAHTLPFDLIFLVLGLLIPLLTATATKAKAKAPHQTKKDAHHQA